MAPRDPNDKLDDLLLGIVDTAIEIACADFGNIQLLDRDSGELQIAAQRGFSEHWIQYWDRQARGKGACGSALQSGTRVIIEDVTQSPVFADPEALDMQIRAGVRAVQSTPLFSRTGKPIGVFSTHYRQPWRPTGAVLRTLDALARLASIAIEQVQVEEEELQS